MALDNLQPLLQKSVRGRQAFRSFAQYMAAQDCGRSLAQRAGANLLTEASYATVGR